MPNKPFTNRYELKKAENSVTTIAVALARALQWASDKTANVIRTALYGNPQEAAAASAEDTGGDMEFALDKLKLRFDRAAEAAAKTLNFNYELGNPAINQWFQEYKLGLIRDITDKQRSTIASIVSLSTARGLPPDRMARMIRESIGLTEYQSGVVQGYRQDLMELNPRALMRELRDGRFDSMVETAITTGQPLTEDQISRAVDAYRRRFIALRATTIARTEALRAATQGHVAAIDAAQKSGDLEGYKVIKTWMATGDHRTRDTHKELDGKEVEGLNTPFVTKKGVAIRWPHDINAPPGETINCRCALRFRYERI